MKKPKPYVSDEEFELIKQAFNEAIAYERGERNNLRVTVRTALAKTNSKSITKAARTRQRFPAPAVPIKVKSKPRATKQSLAQAIESQLAELSEADLRQVVEYIAFLKFQSRSTSKPSRKRSTPGDMVAIAG